MHWRSKYFSVDIDGMYGNGFGRSQKEKKNYLVAFPVVYRFLYVFFSYSYANSKSLLSIYSLNVAIGLLCYLSHSVLNLNTFGLITLLWHKIEIFSFKFLCYFAERSECMLKRVIKSNHTHIHHSLWCKYHHWHHRHT